MAYYLRERDKKYYMELFENMNKSKKSTHEEIERLIKELELEEKKLKYKKEYEQISHTILEYDSTEEFSK
jgi:hypothetical protein